MFTRAQAVIISILAGLVILVFVGLAAVVLLPEAVILVPTPTFTASATVTPTPTFPNFMPTASQITPTPAEPTPTNTPVPTATLPPTRTPRPTVIIDLPTPVVRPTATPTAAPLPPPTMAPAPTATPTQLIERLYSLSFEAEDTSLIEGQCTDLRWQAQGSITLWLDGDPVDQTGRKKVCPGSDRSYTLTFQVVGSTVIERRDVRISVTEEEEE